MKYNVIVLNVHNPRRERGEIGRHDGLKIRYLVIGVRVQVPPFPENRKAEKYTNTQNVNKIIVSLR